MVDSSSTSSKRYEQINLNNKSTYGGNRQIEDLVRSLRNEDAAGSRFSHLKKAEIYQYDFGEVENDDNFRTPEKAIEDLEQKFNIAIQYYSQSNSKLTELVDKSELQETSNRDSWKRTINRNNNILELYERAGDLVERIKQGITDDFYGLSHRVAFIHTLKNLDILIDDVAKGIKTGQMLLGQDGFINNQKLSLTLNKIENILLKQAPAEDIELYNQVMEDQIKAEINLKNAEESENIDTAQLENIIARRTGQLINNYLNNLAAGKDDPDYNYKEKRQAFVTSYQEFQAAAIAARKALAEGAKSQDLLQLKEDPGDNLSIMARMNLHFTKLKELGSEKTAAMEQAARVQAITDQDRSGIISDFEVADRIFWMELDNNQEDSELVRQTLAQNELFGIIEKTSKKFDSNQDSKLSKEELISVLQGFRQAYVNRDNYDSDENVAFFDTNEDGTIGLDDLWSGIYAALGSAHDIEIGEPTTVEEAILKAFLGERKQYANTISYLNNVKDQFAISEDLNLSHSLDEDIKNGEWMVSYSDQIHKTLAGIVWHYTALSKHNSKPEVENTLMDKLSELENLHTEFMDETLKQDRTNYTIERRPVAMATWMSLHEAALLAKGASLEALERYSRLTDLRQQSEAALSNYKYGSNIDVSKTVDKVEIGQNKNKVTNEALYDFSAQLNTVLTKLMVLQFNTYTTDVNNFEFHASVDELVSIFNSAQELTMSNPNVTANHPEMQRLSQLLENQSKQIEKFITYK